MDLKEELKTNKDFQKIVKDSFLDLFENDKFIALMKRFIFSNLTKDEFENINPKKAFAIASMTRTQLMKLINLNCLENDIPIQITNESDFNEFAPVMEEILQSDSKFMNDVKIKIKEAANKAAAAASNAEPVRLTNPPIFKKSISPKAHPVFAVQ